VAQLDETDEPEVSDDQPIDGFGDGEPAEDQDQADDQADDQSDDQAVSWATDGPIDDGPTEEADEPPAEVAYAASYPAWSAEPVPQDQASAEETEVEPAADVPLAPVAMAETDEPAVDAEPRPVRLAIRRPLSATPAASALEGELVPGTNEPLETPIFGQLRSNWLSDEPTRPWAANEVERGWETATEAEDADPEGRTETGLPVRRPGGRLVPGGVTPEPAAANRDPEAIRNRLAAHSAGVSRGRAAAAAQPLNDDYAHEETGPA
jgi:hypothetical protein